MTHPPGTESGYRRTPLSAEENLRAEANFVPYVVQLLAASGREIVITFGRQEAPASADQAQGIAGLRSLPPSVRGSGKLAGHANQRDLREKNYGS